MFMMWKNNQRFVAMVVLLQMMLSLIDGFSTKTSIAFPGRISHSTVSKRQHCMSLFETSKATTTKGSIVYSPIFDFSKKDSVTKFERIDDAIMGGISTSALRQREGEDFARWSGVCRLDGGGFCGTRTLPFEEPLQVGDADGIYLICRLTSDKEPERRVWKITTRSEQSRGEKLYQAEYTLPKGSFDDWSEVVPITVPFTDFKLVSGPRMMVEAAPLNVTGGLYQLGLSLSKFQIAQNLTEIKDFLPGFFELQIKEIGLYQTQPESSQSEFLVRTPSTLSKEEAEKQRPTLVKLLLPLFRVMFSEKSRRRKSAMRILRDRGFSRLGAMNYGVVLRASSSGIVKSIGQLFGILAQDLARTLLSVVLRVVFLPLRILSKAVFAVTKRLGSKERGPKRNTE
jgi:hypothetical protein